MRTSTFLVALLLAALSGPVPAYASGLGKFVGGSRADENETICREDGDEWLLEELGFADRLRWALGAGASGTVGELARGAFVADLGWRLVTVRDPCYVRRASGSRHASYSLSLLADVQAPFAEVGAGIYGLRLAGSVLEEHKGGLVRLPFRTRLEILFAAGPSWSPTAGWGVGAAASWSGIVDLQVRYDFFPTETAHVLGIFASFRETHLLFMGW